MNGQNNSERDCLPQLDAEISSLGHLHGQIHEQMENHIHLHAHEHICPKLNVSFDQEHGKAEKTALNPRGMTQHREHELAVSREVLTIRSHTGLSGDIFLAGLGSLYLHKRKLAPASDAARDLLNDICLQVMPQFDNCLRLKRVKRNGIEGWLAEVDLPEAHEHRNVEEIRNLINSTAISEFARKRAIACFELLAECEARSHGQAIKDIHFHEVGALDSILDICVACELFHLLGSPEVVCGPLPVADGNVRCAHGILPAPAPATLMLLQGVPVYPFAGAGNAGELVTPTGIALARALNASFGMWPEYTLVCAEIVYGQRIFANTANGVIFALGVRPAASGAQ